MKFSLLVLTTITGCQENMVISGRAVVIRHLDAMSRLTSGMDFLG